MTNVFLDFDFVSYYLEFDYVNYKGESSHRKVQVDQIEFGTNEWHKEPQWLMHAYDFDKNENRAFAMRDMTNVRFSAEMQYGDPLLAT